MVAKLASKQEIRALFAHKPEISRAQIDALLEKHGLPVANEQKTSIFHVRERAAVVRATEASFSVTGPDGQSHCSGRKEMKSKLLERYWVHTLELFDGRMKELLSLYPVKIEAFELCRNSIGDPVPGFRMGNGPKHEALAGRQSTPCGPGTMRSRLAALGASTP